MLGARTHVGLTVSRTRALLLVAYFALAWSLLTYFRVSLGVDVLIFVLLGAAVIVGRVRLFVRDWGAFLLVLVLWQHTQLIAKWGAFPLHMRDLISIDRAIAAPFLHGQLPQEWLQQHLYHPGYTTRTHYHDGYWRNHVYYHHPYWDHVNHPVQLQWYDVMSCLTYTMHFPLPLIVGFVLWVRNRALFGHFATAFLTLAAIAFVIYVVYPAVPPWMASRRTYNGQTFAAIPELHKIYDDFNYHVARILGQQGKVLVKVDYNKTAAMPSLHAAFPLLSALYLRKSIGRWGWLMLGYGGMMWFAVVYMAEHWIVDIVVGLVCTVMAYTIVERVAPCVARWAAARRMVPARESVEAAELHGQAEPDWQ
jgi:hypothetical protein